MTNQQTKKAKERSHILAGHF